MLLFCLLLINALLISTALNPMLSNRAVRSTRSLLQCCAVQRSRQQSWSHPVAAHRFTASALFSSFPSPPDSGAAPDPTKSETSAVVGSLKKVTKKSTKLKAAVPIDSSDDAADGVEKAVKKVSKAKVKVKLPKISEMSEDAARYQY
jgi:hypothetical protein